jgi:hypothetical protein
MFESEEFSAACAIRLGRTATPADPQRVSG